MRKRLISFITVFTTIITMFTAFTINASASFTPPFDVTAEAALLVNQDTGKVIFEKNIDKKIYPASLTKVMTTILALEMVPDLENTMVTIPGYIYDEFVGINISHANIRRGEIVSMKSLVYAMMVASGNEAANAVADYLGKGKISNFVELMNKRAKELGCENTTFTNPHGLFDEKQVTTASDLYKITKHALSLPNFLEISSAPVYQMPDTNLKKSWYISTRNGIINKQTPQYYYKYAAGVKTGSLPQVGKNLITTASKDGYNYTLILLGEKDDKACYSTAKSLFEWAFSTFKIKPVIDIKEPVGQVPIKYAWDKDTILLKPEKVYSTLIPESIDISSIGHKLKIPDYVEAPVKKGQVIGTIELTLGDQVIGETNIVSDETVEKSSLLAFIDRTKKLIFSFWFKFAVIVVLILIVLYILLTVIKNTNRRKYKSVRKRKRF